jgi:hypothetical protein
MNTTEADNDFTEGMIQAGREGFTSAQAMVFNIFALMWLQTVCQYQWRHGGSASNAILVLWSKGGITRFYAGLPVALIQGPLARGVAASANFATLAAMSQSPLTDQLPLVVVTAVSAFAAAVFRLLHYPLDTIKTMSQVEGANAMAALRKKIQVSCHCLTTCLEYGSALCLRDNRANVQTRGFRTLWHGATFGVISNVVRHTLW